MLMKLLVGTLSSVALLLLSIYLARLPASTRAVFDSSAVFDSAGILQLTWLLGNEPRLARVGKPDVKSLRKAGMFDVQMSEMALAKIREQPSIEEEDSDHE